MKIIERLTSIVAPLSLVLFVGCSSPPSEEQAPKSNALDIYEVSWNLTDAELKPVATLADIGDTIVFFGPERATVMVEGEIQGESGAVGPFRGSAVVPAADGVGKWIVGIDAKGRLHRVRLHDASTEEVSARYGLERTDVQAVAALGTTDGVAFLLPDGVAVADGVKVRHWKIGPSRQLAAIDTKLALVGDDGVRLFDLTTGTLLSFAIARPVGAAFGVDGRLVVAAGRSVYREESGRLVELHRAAADLHSLVRAGKRVWFGAGNSLGVIDHRNELIVSPVAGIGVTSLVPSSSGDVWGLSSGKVMRFAAAGGDSGAAKTWNTAIKPIFDTSCATCHLPGGLSGIDLSTYDRWNLTRSSLMRRVVVERSMPPRSAKALGDRDREAIRAWLTGHLDE